MKNIDFKKREILKRVGNIHQLAGVQQVTCDQGMAKDTRLINVRNGYNLHFTVIPDKGMDIFNTYYKGIPLTWISKNGLVNNRHFDDKKMGWLRSFGGGMLTTCGLRNTGPAVDDKNEHFGLHGRYSSLAAENISVAEQWDNNDFVIKISGQVREANTFGENLVNQRQIITRSNTNEIIVKDKVTNQCFISEPIMLLYHLNWGYPLLNKNSQLIIDVQETQVRDRHQAGEKDNWNTFSDPVVGIEEVVYFHNLKPNEKGLVNYQLHNPDIGIGIKVEWKKQTLPHLIEWKMMGAGEYVLGLEPANVLPVGRTHISKSGTIEKLDSWETKEVELKISFFDL